jgi:hypothetical protein
MPTTIGNQEITKKRRGNMIKNSGGRKIFSKGEIMEKVSRNFPINRTVPFMFNRTVPFMFMKYKNKMIILLILILFLGVTNINACGFLGLGGSTSWKEEVLLHEGSKIVVERFYHLGGKRTLDSREQRNLDETVSFSLPGSDKKITWQTDFRDSKPEPNSLNLLVLDIVNGTPYIATYAVGCIAYNKWQRPNPPYIFFKYDGNNWQQIPLEKFPAEISKVNVIVGRPPAELLKPFYTTEQVKEQNRNLHEEIFKTIVRTPLKTGSLGVGCEELIYYKGEWISPGDSIGRRMMDKQ